MYELHNHSMLFLAGSKNLYRKFA